MSYVFVALSNLHFYLEKHSCFQQISPHSTYTQMGQGQAKPLPTKDNAIVGRATKIQVSDKHYVLKTKTTPPFDAPLETCVFGTGCFWGTEKGRLSILRFFF